MSLLLCSRNETVRRKWSTSLSTKWKTYQVSSLTELMSLLERVQVDVILVHRSMVDEAQLRQLCGRGTVSKVFVFSDRPDDAEGAACLQLGCVGYANTYTSQSRLVAAVEAVESGLVWVGSSLMQYMISRLPAPSQEDVIEQPNKAMENLSRREYQIARLVADGRNNIEIAQELEITERTVKAHLSSIYAKTQTRGRLNLALLVNKGQVTT